jgi:hypothetical protein
MRRKVIKKMKNISNKIKSRRKRLKNNKPKANNEPLWCGGLNIKENYQNLGLTFDLNKVDKLSNKVTEDIVKEIEVTEEYSLDQIKKMNMLNELTQETSKKKPKITQDEGFIVKNLYKKYGEDFERMYMDHKLNKMMWTANQIQKKFEAFKKKFGSLDATDF